MKHIIERSRDYIVTTHLRTLTDAQGNIQWADEAKGIAKHSSVVTDIKFYESTNNGNIEIRINAADILSLAEFIKEQRAKITEDFI